MHSREEKPSQIVVTVEPLVESDIEKFNSILAAHVWNRETHAVVTSEIEAIKRYMRGEVDEYGRTRTYLVAKDQSGKVVGCMAYSSPDPDMVAHFQLENPDETIELLNAFVSPEIFRGGGVGRKLLESICEIGRQHAKKQLLIHSGPRYQDSWGFYDKMSGGDYGFIQNKYGAGRHAKTWKIELQPSM